MSVQDVERDVAQEVLTPTVRRGIRRWLGWISIGVIGVLAVGVTLLLAGGTQSGTAFDPESAAPNGTRALVEVLRQQGVDVRVTESLDDTRDAVADPGDTTVLLDETQVELDYDDHLELTRLADRLVLVTPDYFTLGDFSVPVSPAGPAEGEVDADCELPAVEAAGRVLADGSSYRFVGGDGVACLETDDDAFGLVQVEDGGRTITVLGLRDAFTNEHIASDGNAALGLHLLGATDRLIWYTPGADDLDPSTAPTFESLQPPFQAALALLGVALFVAAAVWRGRRFGPLVVERLPVTVPTSETMDGRARLYQRASARLRTLDALRIGTVSRLATAIGLPRTATVAEVIDAVAALLGRDRAPLVRLLLDADPAGDDELVRLSDELLLLERDVVAAARGR